MNNNIKQFLCIADQNKFVIEAETIFKTAISRSGKWKI